MTQLNYLIFYLMTRLLCIPKIQQTLDVVELVCSIKILSQLRSDDLSFDESIVIELNFDSKKFFFTVIYGSPAFSHTSPEFKVFLSNFTNLYSKIEKRLVSFIYFIVDNKICLLSMRSKDRCLYKYSSH